MDIVRAVRDVLLRGIVMGTRHELVIRVRALSLRIGAIRVRPPLQYAVIITRVRRVGLLRSIVAGVQPLQPACPQYDTMIWYDPVPLRLTCVLCVVFVLCSCDRRTTKLRRVVTVLLI